MEIYFGMKESTSEPPIFIEATEGNQKTGEERKIPLHLRLLGTFSLHVHGQEVTSLSRAGRWLLGLLALRQAAPVSREWIATNLWPETAQAQSLFYLRRTLSKLRAALGPEVRRLTSPTRSTLHLDLSDCVCDLFTFDSLVTREDVFSLERAVALYRGPLLTDCDASWALYEREARAERYVNALESLANVDIQGGDFENGIQKLRRVLEMDPLRERVHRQLMQALGKAGDYAGVERQYREVRRRLHAELHLEPSAETTALYQCLKREARQPAPGSVPAEIPYDNVPAPIGNLIGREAQRNEIAQRLQTTRLLTLTGSGGIGKTRLAQAVAQAAWAEFSHGAVWVQLASLASEAQVATQIAMGLQLRERSGETVLQALTAFLRTRSLLLVLDNCEHLLKACGEIARTLLSACPRLKILATSRQALGLFGEEVWRVPSLTLPAPVVLNVSETALLEAVEASEAARLFVERARAVQKTFRLSEENAEAVASICAKLGGIPLAIELAAVWVNALSLPEIARRLEDQFALLARGDRTASSRHQTLRQAMDWSYGLLGSDEQVLLARLSVFAGGWTLEAAEAVCFEENAGRERTLYLLHSLTEKSLVETGERNGEVRYHLLEPVRQYGQVRLMERGEQTRTLQRHHAYFLALAAQISPLLSGPHLVEALERMEAEHDNFRRAFRFSLDDTSEIATETSLRLALLLALFRGMRGYYREALEAIQEAMRHNPEAEALVRAEALQKMTQLSLQMGDHQATFTFGREAERLYRQYPPSSGLLMTLRYLGNVQFAQDGYAEAKAILEEGLALSRQIADRDNEARLQMSLGILAKFKGDLAGAQSLLEAAARHFEAASLLTDAGVALHNLGNVFKEQGQWEMAKTYFQRSLDIHRRIGNRPWMGINLVELSGRAGGRDLTQSRALALQALALCRTGNRSIEPQCHGMLSHIERQEGNLPAARAYLEEAIRLQYQMGQKRNLTYQLLEMCCLLRDEGFPAPCVQLTASVVSLREKMNSPLLHIDLLEIEELYQDCRELLAEDAFAAAHSAGARMTLEEAVALALQGKNRSGDQNRPYMGTGFAK